jgi:hypothetical protein
MSLRILKLNHDKTDLIVFAPQKRDGGLSDISLAFDGCINSVSLEAYFDQSLGMDQHVSDMARLSF